MLIRNIDTTPRSQVALDGVKDVSMSIMVGREDGAPTFALRHFVVEPHGHTPRHAHDYEHEVFIVDGSGHAMQDDQDHPIRRGDVLYVPADRIHQFKAGPDGLRFLCLVPVTRNCGDPTPGS